MKKVKVKAEVKLNTYQIIDDAIYSAVRYGYNRAHKYSDNPSEESMIEQIHRAVMNDLNEIINFDDEK